MNCSDINFEGCNIYIVRVCENLLLCTGKATSYWKGHEKRNMCIFNFNNEIKSSILFSHGKDMYSFEQMKYEGTIDITSIPYICLMYTNFH